MERTVPSPATRLEHGRPFYVWYGIAAGPTVWALVGALAWWVDSRACVAGEPSWGPFSGGTVRMFLIALAGAAIVASVAALAASLHAWRQTTDRTSLTEAYGYGIAEYLAIAGVFISGVFVLAMVWTGLPTLVLNLCEGTR